MARWVTQMQDAEDYLKEEEESDFKVVAKRRAKRPKRCQGNGSSSEEEFPPLNPPQSQMPVPSNPRNTSQTSRNKVDTFRDKSGIYLLQQKNCSPPSVLTQETAPEASPIRKPPPIVVHGRGHFLKVKQLASANNLQDCTFRETPEGLKVFPSTPDDYRLLVRALQGAEDAESVPFHTYQMADEKQLKIVLRGVPQELPIEDISEDLQQQGYIFDSVVRMSRGSRAFNLVLVNAPKSPEGRKCFDIRHVLGVMVKTEPKRKPTGAQQCYRCQERGHVSFRCFAHERCAFCLEPHPTKECKNARGPGLPAKCVLCKGDHPAFSTKCPLHPIQVQKTKEAQKKKVLEKSNIKQGVSYAAVSKSGSNNNNSNNNTTLATPPGSDLIKYIQKAVQEALSQMMPYMLAQLRNG